jgi:hypothetical protein
MVIRSLSDSWYIGRVSRLKIWFDVLSWLPLLVVGELPIKLSHQNQDRQDWQ